MIFEFTVTPDADGAEPFTVKTGMRDIRAWEKTHRGRSMGQLSDNAGMSATILFELAATSCRRQGIVSGTMSDDDFVEQFDIDFSEDEQGGSEAPEPGDPTLSAA